MDQNPVHVVVGHHGLDDQCITMWVMDMACVLFTEGDKVRLTSELFGRPSVRRACGRNWPFIGLSEVVVLGSPHFPGEVWSIEDSSDHTGRFCLLPILAGLDVPVADVVLKIPLSDEFFDLVLVCDAFFYGVANILVISVVLILVSLRVVSQHRIRSFVDSCVLCGQEYIITRPRQVSEVTVFAQMGSMTR